MCKQNKTFVKAFLFVVLVSVLLACTVPPSQTSSGIESITPSSTNAENTATFVPTYTSTIGPTQTSTQVPALVSHEWIPQDPLIIFGGSGGDGGCGFEPDLPQYFIVLSTGELFITDWNDALQTDQIRTTKLSRQTTCNLLNSIDQAGFFDYDPSTYISDQQKLYSLVMGAGSNYISVQAWRFNSVSLYDLGEFLNMDEIKKAVGTPCAKCPNFEFPIILPSLRKTYELLDKYKPAELHNYQSANLGLWIDTYPQSNEDIVWPLKSIDLSKIVSPTGESSNKPNIILYGSDAATVFRLFNRAINVCGVTMIQDAKKYRVFVRPLLPNEFQSTKPIQTNTLSCSPSDGWVNIP